MSSSSPYHCVTPLETSISEKSIRTCGQEQIMKQYFLMLMLSLMEPTLLLPCRCPSSLGCKTSCYFSRTRPTSWFGLPGVKHQIQTCKRKTLLNTLDISDRYSQLKCAMQIKHFNLTSRWRRGWPSSSSHVSFYDVSRTDRGANKGGRTSPCRSRCRGTGSCGKKRDYKDLRTSF